MELRLLTILLPFALCQIKPDVSFDNRNDRFDLTPLMQEGSYDQWGDAMDGVRRYNRVNRRNDAKTSDTKVSDVISKFMEALRRFQQNLDFKPQDGAESVDSEEKEQMRKDLINYLHERRPDENTRRSGNGRTQADIDREVMMHHAVPIVMKVEGIMQLPRQDRSG